MKNPSIWFNDISPTPFKAMLSGTTVCGPTGNNSGWSMLSLMKAIFLFHTFLKRSLHNHKASALAIATVVVILLSTVPIGSTLASTKSFSNTGNNIKTETEKSKPHHGALNLPSQPRSHISFEHSSHCRHHQYSMIVNIFRHRLQSCKSCLHA